MSKASDRVKTWRKANPEKYREQKRNRYRNSPAHREKELARGREYKSTVAAKELRKAARVKNRLKENTLARIAGKRRRKIDPRRAMFHSAKKRARDGGLEFSIAMTDIHVPTSCPLLGIALAVNDKTLGPGSPTLDRIFNHRGYVPGNVVVISYAANRCKGNLCADDIMRLAVNLKVLEAFRAPA